MKKDNKELEDLYCAKQDELPEVVALGIRYEDVLQDLFATREALENEKRQVGECQRNTCKMRKEENEGLYKQVDWLTVQWEKTTRELREEAKEKPTLVPHY